MEIKIETLFVPLVFELKKQPPEGISVYVPPVEMKRTIDSQDIALAIITTISLGIPASVLANWIYDKIKGKAENYTKIIINKKEVRYNKGEIQKIIEEEMVIEQKDISHKNNSSK
jgi:hypothetical protein